MNKLALKGNVEDVYKTLKNTILIENVKYY